MRNNKAQQEMVGFVLIVIIVVIGIMVFLIISVNAPEEQVSLETSPLLMALMRMTTECAVVFEPQYDDFEDLFKSCYKNSQCKNLEKSSCDYLNESLREVVGALMKSEATVEAYEIDFLVKGEKDFDNFPIVENIVEKGCKGTTSSSQETLISGSQSLIIRLKLCKMV